MQNEALTIKVTKPAILHIERNCRQTCSGGECLRLIRNDDKSPELVVDKAVDDDYRLLFQERTVLVVDEHTLRHYNGRRLEVDGPRLCLV